jgi:bifunctional DNA-binding transcriptional regulator/antitoxin component of YhaV-PrlF toxin-antitoxin module
MAKLKESKASYTAEPITTVTARGQTEIPRALRERYRVTAKSRLRWVDTGAGLLIVPVKQTVAGKSGKLQPPASAKPRMGDREFLAWLEAWMKEPDDWTPEQWDEFERELRTHRLKSRDIDL